LFNLLIIEQLTWDNIVLNFVTTRTFPYTTQITEPNICTEVTVQNEREEKGIFTLKCVIIVLKCFNLYAQ